MNRRWYFACAGAILLALLIRQPLILIVGLLALLVVITIDIWATYCLTDLHFEHELSEKRVAFGTEVILSVAVENAKLLPLPWLEIEDNLSRTLRVRGRQLRVNPTTNRAVLESLFSTRWYERVTRRYTIQCNTRGVHTFGPTTLSSGDLFGFTRRVETLENRQYLIVYPLIVPLSSFSLPARHPFGDRRAPRRLLEDPSRVIGVRDYVYGDDLRRIHWKATARTMQLQSKIYEPTTTHTLVMFLNVSTQSNVYFGTYPELLELSVCAAASVADWAVKEGYAVGLYTNSIELGTPQDQDSNKQRVANPPGPLARPKQRHVQLPPSRSAEQHKRIMEALARVQDFFGNSLEETIQSERTRLPAGATVVVITVTISDPLLDALRRLRQAGHAVTILLVSNQPIGSRLGGVPVHYLGGEETWKKLTACYNLLEGKEQQARDAQQEVAATAFHL